MLNKKIVMCGCHEFGSFLIPALINSGVEFSYFVCLTPEQGETNKISGYYDFHALAKKHNIPLYIPKKYSLEASEDIAFFSQQKFDLLIQGGWQRLFPEQILKTLSIGAIGSHGSANFLPKGRGRSPLNWSIITKQKRFILQLFLMTPGMDDGDVFSFQDFDINDYDNIRTLYYKVAIATKKMLLNNLKKICSGDLKFIKQQGKPSYYPKRNIEDGEIDWQKMDIIEIYNLIRATTHPYPGAFDIIEGKKRIIWEAVPFDTRLTYADKAYGEIVEYFNDDLVINCLGGLLLITDYEIIENMVSYET